MLRKRFKKELSEDAVDFLSSIEQDRVEEDILGSQAHANALAKAGIITKKEAREIISRLEKIRKDYKAGKFVLDPEKEDVHMNIEAALGEKGKKLHTARSRNDQVVLDTRIHTKKKIYETECRLKDLIKTILSKAEKNADKPMPGYTHMQIAQPVTFGFWLTAYAQMLARDLERLADCQKRVNKSPLGAAALAGTSFPIDRKAAAKELGFDGIVENAMDAVSSRDFVSEALFCLAQIGQTLSRLANELTIFSTGEFSLIEIPEEYSSSSSIMPQKKNPDIAELIRGKTAKLTGLLVSSMQIQKMLPMGYSRDFQEIRGLLWEAFAIVIPSLELMRGMMAKIKFNYQRGEELASASFSYATELANYLAREKKIPFREAHGKVAEFVRSGGKDPSELGLSKQEFEKVTDVHRIIDSYTTAGGTSEKSVLANLKNIAKRVEKVMVK